MSGRGLFRLVAWGCLWFAWVGPMSADALSASVPGNREALEGLVDTGAPNRAALERTMEKLVGDDPVVREAAVRRLMPYPEVAAGAVVERFAEGGLSERLATLELLEAWGAPVEGVDPWAPETVTPERVEQMRAWVSERPAEAGRRQGSGSEGEAIRDLDEARREIRKLLGSDDPVQVRVIQERLSRVGEGLLPEVYAQLRSARTDESRQRLTALRYRLVASDRLALTWPDGLDRLAATSAGTRHAALDELEKRATGADRRLLLELFSDPDALIRERSLRSLQSMGGAETMQALVLLLQDPEPNVRAAVLKQLVERPQVGMVDEVIRYIESERDANLVVYGVRVLREVRTGPSIEALKGLLEHEMWQVRAEAVEALGQIARQLRRESMADSAAIYSALVKLLEDEDGFVVSRAVIALADARLSSAMEPLVRAADRHPELAAEVIRGLIGEEGAGRMALPHLRELSKHGHAEVRAAAIGAVAQVVPNHAGEEIGAGLKDESGKVRTAAAEAMVWVLESLRPDVEEDSSGGGFGLFGSRRARQQDPGKWLEEFRGGRRRPKWMEGTVEDLVRMLGSSDDRERIPAAVVLCALGHEDEALGVLMGEAEAQGGEAKPQAGGAKARAGVSWEAARALPWLPWEKRRALFDRLVGQADGNADALVAAVEAMVVLRDKRAAEALWGLPAQEGAAGEELMGVVHDALRELYVGDRYWAAESIPRADREAAVELSVKMSREGTSAQRSVALALLLLFSREDAAREAEAVFAAAGDDAALRADALQVMLLSKPSAAGQALAAEHVGDPALREISIRYLAGGSEALRQMRGSIYLYYQHDDLSMRYSMRGQGEAVRVEPPAGLEGEKLRGVMGELSDETAAYAGYLLMLLGEREGFEPLERHWREDARSWRRLMYRGIAALNDDELTPVLEEIYEQFSPHEYEMREFYWTIRSMSGERILALRKRIRDEVGMQRLR